MDDAKHGRLRALKIPARTIELITGRFAASLRWDDHSSGHVHA